MIYHVKTSETAELEMKEIADYISDILYSPQAAYNLMYELRKQVRTLNQMPKRYALVSDERLAKNGIRAIPVKNYSIFYTVDDQTLTVTIINVMHSGRDWVNLL